MQQVRLLLQYFNDQRAKHAVRPRESTPREVGGIVAVKAFVHLACRGRAKFASIFSCEAALKPQESPVPAVVDFKVRMQSRISSSSSEVIARVMIDIGQM